MVSIRPSGRSDSNGLRVSLFFARNYRDIKSSMQRHDHKDILYANRRIPKQEIQLFQKLVFNSFLLFDTKL